MATITITVKDDVEKQFRKTAQQIYGKQKGYLGKAVTEAMSEWANKETVVTALEKMMEKGFNLGGMTTKKRSDWHER